MFLCSKLVVAACVVLCALSAARALDSPVGRTKIESDPNRWYDAKSRSWDAAELMNGLSHMGDLERVARVLDRLDQGKPITVVSVGSSVTFYGGCYGIKPSLFRSHNVTLPNPTLYDQQKGYCKKRAKGGYLATFMKFVNDRWPNKRHLLVNNGFRAHSISDIMWAECYDLYFPPHIDLVFIETSVVRTQTVDVEHMVRFLLDRPGRPAVVMWHMFRYCKNDKTCLKCFETGSPQYCTEKVENALFKPGPFQYSPQDAFVQLQEWYNLPGISLRDFLHTVWHDKRTGNSTKPSSWGRLISRDGRHPHPHGKASEFYSDAFVQLLAVADRLRRAGLLPPKEDTVSKRLPPPLDKRTAQVIRKRCYSIDPEEKDGHHVPLETVKVDGFKYIESYMAKGVKVYKPGWYAQHKGASMSFAVNTMAKAVGKGKFKMSTIKVSYLHAHDFDSIGELRCVEGCTCEPKTVKSKNPVPESVPVQADLVVEQSERCVVELKVSESSNDHRFKLTGLVAVVP